MFLFSSFLVLLCLQAISKKKKLSLLYYVIKGVGDERRVKRATSGEEKKRGEE
jgi:hypothetical protein